ncbi:DUF1353 domain-containing protein [Yoonia sp. SS1-5]|uniref:DUF1353 domain-containing protein n=1 Tax=Yoonia rhodophyticola TaxID=3137370 RepID=A0AAN0NIZ6_9RHOB
MKCYHGPLQASDPYPAPGTPVAAASFESSLVLFRPVEGIVACDGTTPRDGEDVYLTGAPLVCRWQDDQQNQFEVVVTPGFVTDLTSVPAPLRGLISRAGPWLEAAILHDYLYVAWQDLPGRGALPDDRRFADRVMLAAMRAAGVGVIRRFAIFAAVRIFGGPGYRTARAFRFGDATDPRLVHLAAVPDLVEDAPRIT